jgi:D-alanine-D-alanine ligase-like ATP-grasp enzyme
MKIQTLVRLFPYFPTRLDSDLMIQYRLSIQKSELKYRILFYISDLFCRFKSGDYSGKNRIFNHEISVLHIASNKFILQKYLFHVYNKGSKSEKEIINNKERFHNFCIKNQFPTPRLLGIIKNGKVQSLVQGLPWNHANDFFIKPVSGSQSRGILELRAKDNNTFEIVNQNRLIKAEYLLDFINFHLKTGEYIIQEKAGIFPYFATNGQSNVPILRIISIKIKGQIKILNPVLIINKGKQFLNSELINKDFYAVNAENGTIIGEIIFKHTPPKLDGFKMPDWDVILTIIKKAHNLLGTTNIIGWDVAVTEGGYSLLEANKNPWLEIHQKSPFESTLFIEKLLNLN